MAWLGFTVKDAERKVNDSDDGKRTVKAERERKRERANREVGKRERETRQNVTTMKY